MSYQLRLLLLSLASIALLLAGAFFVDWYTVTLSNGIAHIDLRDIHVCTPHCLTQSVADVRGNYASFAPLAFWSSVALFIVVVSQCGSRLLAGTAFRMLARVGIGLGAIGFLTALLAGYQATPAPGDLALPAAIDLTRGLGALALLVGCLTGGIAVRYALVDATIDSNHYTAVEVDPATLAASRHADTGPLSLLSSDSSLSAARTKSPTQQPVVARTKSAGVTPADARTTSSTQPPETTRTKSSTEPPMLSTARTRSSTQPPVTARTTSSTQPPAVGRTSSSTQPPIDARTKNPSDAPLLSTARTTSSTQPPVVARTRSPTQPASTPVAPLSVDLAARLAAAAAAKAEPPTPAATGAGAGIDLAARLAAAAAVSPVSGVEVSIRPQLPEAPVVPADQIPVDPGSGLVIRKRTTSTMPPLTANASLPPDVGISVRTRPPTAPAPLMPAVASALGLPHDPLHGRVNYLVTVATLTRDGIQAKRVDGTDKRVGWSEIVGIVARRLPAQAPFGGTHFVDIVSTRGATLRIVPTTRIEGHELVADPIERTRELVNVVAAQALDAKLDSATKAFASGTSKAAQLRDEAMLASHDDRLA